MFDLTIFLLWFIALFPLYAFARPKDDAEKHGMLIWAASATSLINVICGMSTFYFKSMLIILLALLIVDAVYFVTFFITKHTRLHNAAFLFVDIVAIIILFADTIFALLASIS